MNLADGVLGESDGFKITGAKKSICTVTAPETYANCEIFFSKIQLNEIDYQRGVKEKEVQIKIKLHACILKKRVKLVLK